MRLATLVQMAPSLVPALTDAARPALTAATWALAVTSLVGLAVVVLARRRPPGTPYALADVGIAVVLLVAGLWSVPVPERLGSWVGFQAAYALCVACSLVGVRSRARAFALVAVLATAEAVYLAPTVDRWADLLQLVSNILTILVIGPLAWVCAGMLIRIGAEADEAHRLAADLATAEEERRARTAMHNGTAVMRLLMESTDGAQAPGLRQQAEIELNRMRAYLTGDPLPATTGSTSLAAVVTAARAEFDDLPVTLVTDLATGVELDRALADDLAAALRSLLLNVRLHARADQVVLHAEERDDRDGWEVSVHDNGVGFAPDETSYGVGIRDVVVGQLARSGVRTDIDSVPGLGTTVTLTLATADDTDTDGSTDTPDVTDHNIATT
jgi:signal transduction histidine kinase